MSELAAEIPAAAAGAAPAGVAARHNMLVNVLDVAFYIFGESMVSIVVVVPAFMLKLGAAPALVALLPAIQVLGTRLPPLATSYLVEGTPRVLQWCMLMSFGQRLPYLAIGVLTLLLASHHPTIVLWAVVGGVALGYTSFGLGSPAYGELIAKAIAPARRGLFMGVSMMLGSALGIVGGLVVTLVMASGMAFADNFATLFLIATGVLGISLIFFSLNREPPGDGQRHHTSFLEYLRELPQVLRRDRNFCWYLAYQSLIYGYAMGSGLFMAYAVRHIKLGDAFTGRFLLVSTITTAIASPVLGVLGDRVGHKAVLAIACAAHMLAAAIATAADDWRAMCAVFSLTAICLTAQVVSARNYIFLFGINGRRPTYLALANTIPAPFILLFALAGGFCVNQPKLGYAAAFIMSGILCAIALVVLIVKVQTPYARDKAVASGE